MIIERGDKVMLMPVDHGNWKKIIGKVIFLSLGILMWIMAILNQTYIRDYHGAVSIRYKEPVITARQMESILEGMVSREEYNIPEVTLWQRDEDIVITNEDNKASVTLSLVTVTGDMSKVYPQGLSYGGYLAREDYKGCVIDKGTAYELFGSENAVGLTISLNEKEYTIIGILQGVDVNTMIIQEEQQKASKAEGKKYSCMELAFSDTEDTRQVAETFILANGLGIPLSYIDGYSYQELSYFLIHFPLWFGALLLIIYFIRRVSALKGSRVLYFGGWLMIILLSALLINLTNVHIYYPDTLLPTRWSDFDFWGNQWKLLKASFGGREGSILLYKDIMLTRRITLVVAGVFGAMISIGLGKRMYNTEEEVQDA